MSRHLTVVTVPEDARVNCALWTVCGRDSAGHAHLVEAHTEDGDTIDAELFLCDAHQQAVLAAGQEVPA